MAEAFTTVSSVGRARFNSVVRGWDEDPLCSFAVELAGMSVRYGVWRPVWASNHNDFGAEISGYGWIYEGAVGHPSPSTRTKFSADQAVTVQSLVIALFRDVAAREEHVPFSNKVAPFLDRVEFKKHWILLAD